MKALVKHTEGQYNMEIQDVPEPSPGPGQVKVAVQAAGICGSDLHIYYDKIGIPMRYPVVVGHEFAGTIVELGENVTHCKVGTPVVSETTFSTCGQCWWCRHGSDQLCKDRHVIGYWENGIFFSRFFLYLPVPAIKSLTFFRFLVNKEKISRSESCPLYFTNLVAVKRILSVSAIL